MDKPDCFKSNQTCLWIRTDSHSQGINNNILLFDSGFNSPFQNLFCNCNPFSGSFVIPSSSIVSAIIAAPYSFAIGRNVFIDFSSPFTELIRHLPPATLRAASIALGFGESRQRGISNLSLNCHNSFRKQSLHHQLPGNPH